MRAIIQDRYGTPGVIRLEERPVPRPAAGEVLVRVEAVSLNLSDWEGLRGKPLYARLAGLRRPRQPIPGSDVAGLVEAVGEGVTRFTTGDAVFGDLLSTKGALAEYVAAPEGALSLKPPDLSFAEAACLLQSGSIVLAAIHGQRPVRAGERVLVNGGGGGAGAFAIQLAKAARAEVTGVDNDEKLDFMRSLGADHVIDYRRADYSRSGKYDLVLDLVAHRSILTIRRALKPGGRYYLVGGGTLSLLQAGLLGPLLSPLLRRRIRLLIVQSGPAQAEAAAALCLSGQLKVHIDRTFPLEETAAALAYHGEGHARGKVVVMVASEGRGGAPDAGA